jgi:hypothetical protein
MATPIMKYSKKLQNDNFEVTYEIDPLYDLNELGIKSDIIRESLISIESQQACIENKINDLNINIERLTNHADGIDYSVAVGCGVLCGLVDSFWVGEIDFDNTLGKIKEKVNNYVSNKAEKTRISETVNKAVENAKKKAAAKGKILSKEEIESLKAKVAEGVKNKYRKVLEQDSRDGTVNALRRSITKLEKTFKLASDNAHLGIKGMNAASHHLADIAHHPTPLGLVAAIIGEVFRTGILVDKNGKWHIVWLGADEEAKKRIMNLVIPIVIAGLVTWVLNVAESKYKDEIDKNLPKPLAKILHALIKAPLAITVLNSIRKVFSNWWGHLASDMAGSKSTPGEGMGIPGIFVSLLKELSSIPPLNYTGLPKVIDNIYTQNRFDMRAELAVVTILGKQSIPVLMGEILVRFFYFIRHLTEELSNNNLKDVNWSSVIPFNNRTITRMITIETGTFTACDLADAAIRSTIKTGGPENPLFWKDMILKVNFVGIGRFAIAVASDVKMGVNRKHVIEERMSKHNQLMMLENAKIWCYQENMWICATDAAKAMQNLQEIAVASIIYYNEQIHRIDNEWTELSSSLAEYVSMDSDFEKELLDIL